LKTSIISTPLTAQIVGSDMNFSKKTFMI